MRDRVLDLVFLVGVLLKGVDGVVELIVGVVLLIVTPAQLRDAADALTAPELAEDPHDLLAHVLLRGVENLDAGTASFLAAYLLIHGVVKIGIVGALVLGTRRVYPWAVAVLLAFLGYQVYELVVHPTVVVALLTVFDALIVLLTWREWREGRTLRETLRSTTDWLTARG
ncbi:DUF2127 domain-containing protein [Isoptericola sp. b408]|uniref:DUF2127 domain-containing protein n=1 Tax=Isoptericola sp. b408 TaxID=3064653 RepID=UPI0027129D09|nr:DUF2127 domain-containing protein [Isoptericola sp. b408]MDO8150485.1 DUF2127 domain-containing protein [Isoptericola sp. b408]